MEDGRSRMDVEIGCIRRIASFQPRGLPRASFTHQLKFRGSTFRVWRAGPLTGSAHVTSVGLSSGRHYSPSLRSRGIHPRTRCRRVPDSRSSTCLMRPTCCDFIFLLGVILWLPGCDESHATATSEKPPAAIVTAGPPLEKPVIDYVEFTGRTDAVESVEIRARVTGFLKKVFFVRDEETDGKSAGGKMAKR